MSRRLDYMTALRIELRLLGRPKLGTPKIAEELAKLGLGMDVALRVLARPASRRRAWN